SASPKGTLNEGSVSCPWHGSEFALKDGQVINGPATQSQPCLDVRERGAFLALAISVRVGQFRVPVIASLRREIEHVVDRRQQVDAALFDIPRDCDLDERQPRLVRRQPVHAPCGAASWTLRIDPREPGSLNRLGVYLNLQ